MRLLTIALLFSSLHVVVAVLFPDLLTAILVLAAVIVGASGAAYWSRDESCLIPVSTKPLPTDSSGLPSLNTTAGLHHHPRADLFKSHLLVSKNVDPVIEQLVDLILRDFVFSFYKAIVPQGQANLHINLKNELWIVVSRFVNRIRSFEENFITKDVIEILTKHVRQVNNFLQKKEKYVLCSQLRSTEQELLFLRQVSSLLLAVFLPKVYLDIPPLQSLLREVVAVQVLYNLIETLADPDFVNNKILDYLKSCEKELEQRKKTKYAFAETFDHFVAMIRSSTDGEELKRIRYFIVTEIMQATAINNLKHERGLDVTKERVLKGSSTKGDHLLSRNLPRYLNQLKFAKKVCEKRMSKLAPHDASHGQGMMQSLPTQKVLFPFGLIMSNETGRQLFQKFLVSSKSSSIEQSAQHLISFWEAVNQMKLGDAVKQVEIAHQLLSHSYFLSSINCHIRIPKEVLKEMENFILGNVTPLAFYKTQKVVYKVLEERYFPLFVVSKFYDEMVQETGKSLSQEESKRKVTFGVCRRGAFSENGLNAATDVQKTVIDEHIDLSEETLKTLQKNLHHKTASLTALNQTMDISSKQSETTTRIIGKLEKEIADIKNQISAEECHLSRSILWHSFLGEWRAELYYIDTEQPEAAVAAIIVHLGSLSDDMRCDAWVIARTMAEVVDLKRKLVKIKPSLSRIEIFRLRNVKEDNAAMIERATASMNQFFRDVLEDENCFKTEEVYLFFSSSPEDVRRPICQKRKPRTKKTNPPLAHLFGFANSQSKGQEDTKMNEDEELCQFFEDLSNKDGLKDDIAEPAYNLLDEVFELQEGVGWIRKSLIAFVQISYGKTINKQIHETVSWLTSDTMFGYYLSNLKEGLWPNDELIAAGEVRSRDQKERTYATTRQKLLQNIPDLVISLMGESTSKQRILKLFDVMQQRDLNKELLYQLLDVFLRRLVPELESSAGSQRKE